MTAGVFETFGSYETLCQELNLETAQERHHIHAFHMIGYKTKRALLGQTAFNASTPGKSNKKNDGNQALASGNRSQFFSFNLQSSILSSFQDSALHFITNKVMLKNQTLHPQSAWAKCSDRNSVFLIFGSIIQRVPL